MPSPNNNPAPGAPAPAPQDGGRAPLFNPSQQHVPIWDRDMGDVPPITPSAPPAAPTPAFDPYTGKPLAPQTPQAPAPAPQAPNPQQTPEDGTQPPQDDDKGGDFNTNLEKAREKFQSQAPQGESEAERIARLEGENAALKAGVAPSAPPQLDENGKPIGDPSKPWWEKGSAQEPDSWADAAAKITELVVEGVNKSQQERVENDTKEQERATQIITGQQQALLDSGVVQNQDQMDGVKAVAIKYRQPDLMVAAELWNSLGQPDKDGNAPQTAQADEQRRQVMGQVNHGQGSVQPGQAGGGAQPKPNYQQIHNRSMDQIMIDAIAGLDQNVR